jgi:predicted permease
MTTILNDVKYALRQLRKSPGFTVVAVVTLGLGIGANTAFFGVLNTTLLHPLPYPQSRQLVHIQERSIKSNRGMSVPYPDFIDWKRMQTSFTALTIYHPSTVHLMTETGTERVPIAQVDHDFLKVLGYQPMLGRDFTAEDDQTGAPLAVLVTHGEWLRRFNCDPEVLGRTIQVDGQSAVIVGVLPAEFQFFRNCELILPLGPFVERMYMHMRESRSTTVVMGRLRSHRSFSAARVEMDAIAARLTEQYPKTNADVGVTLTDLRQHLVGNTEQQQVLLMSAVGLVLLIVCVNVANLALARSCSRNQEMAIRTALGAGRGRLVRQMMVEHLLLAVIGSGLGLLLAAGLSTILDSLVPFQIRHLNPAGVSIIDVRVGIFTFIITLLTGLGFGLAPAWQLSHANAYDVLKDRSATNRYSLGRSRAAGVLVAAQVGLATILVIAAGLILRSLWSLSSTPLGYQADKVLSLRLASPLLRMDGSFLRAGAFYTEAAERLAQLPGVEAAAAVSDMAFGGSSTSNQFRLLDRPVPTPSQYPSCRRRIISRDYFRAMGIPLLQGRCFDGREPVPSLPPDASTVSDFLNALGTLPMDTVVTRSFAQHYWPGDNPIGKRFMVGSPNKDLCVLTVIGVVGDTTQDNLAQTDHEEFYFSIRQLPLYPEFSLILRTRDDPSSVINTAKVELRKMTATEPVYDVRLISSRVAESISGRSFQTQLISLFAGVALLLASVGVYGVLAFNVGRRTREIGVRIALGASPRHTIWNVISRGFTFVLPGLVLGLLGVWALGRYIENQLYGVTVTDPLTYAIGSLTLLLSAVLACWIPARRAAKIDPMEALRYE